MNEYQFQSTVQFLNDKFDELNPRERWSACTRLNLPLIKKEDSVYRYHNLYTGDNEKAMVIVGASPALKRDMEYLKTLNDKYVIMVSNSAAKILIDNGIKPHYVISIDGDDVIANRDLKFDSSDITLITTNASSPKVIKQWKGRILWSPCYAIEPQLKKKVRNLLGKRIPMGGNTSSFATSLAFEIFGARMFIFVGNEYCYDNQYYAHKRSKWEDKNVTHFKTVDVTGKERLTNIPLFQYKMWLEKMIDQLSFCTFIDTSYGMLGTDCKKLNVMPLKAAIDFVDNSFDLKEKAKTDWHVREKLRYDVEYSNNSYQPTVGMRVWKALFKRSNMSEIKSVLDVGCGFGPGVALCRNKGIEAYGVDISESLIPYWQMANIVPFCQVASADNLPYPDNNFDLVASFDVLEHIPEEGIDKVLKEIFRVGRNSFLFSICITPAISKMHDGSEPHVLIRPIDWWREKILSIGYKLYHFSLNHTQFHVTVAATKNNNEFIIKKGTANDGSKVSSERVYVQQRGKVLNRQDGIEVACSH